MADPRWGVLYSAADDGVTGSELWRIDPGAISEAVGSGCGPWPQTPTLVATDPVLGQVMQFDGGAMPTAAPFAMVLGAPALGVRVQGSPCLLPVAPRTGTVVATGITMGSGFTLGLAIPSTPALINVRAAAYAVVADAGAPLGVSVTNGMALTLGR